MGYMFEDIIRRFSENGKLDQHYTPREVIALMVNLLLIEADEELFVDKELEILDTGCWDRWYASNSQEVTSVN